MWTVRGTMGRVGCGRPLTKEKEVWLGKDDRKSRKWLHGKDGKIRTSCTGCERDEVDVSRPVGEAQGGEGGKGGGEAGLGRDERERYIRQKVSVRVGGWRQSGLLTMQWGAK